MNVAQPLVSVVAPLYNGARYLSECIESVRAQTYPNWQFTILNNCSTDGSREIAERYAAQDARIRVHTNTAFLPIIDNHNAALSLISPDSRYCKPLMADDWLFPECLEKMVACAETHPSAGLISAYMLKGSYIRFQEGLPYPTTVVPGREICRQALLEEVYPFGCPTAMMIRADLVRRRQPFYNPANLHADEESCYDVLQESDFAFVHQILSFFRTHGESQTAAVSGTGSFLVGRLHILQKYGRIYLSEQDFERRQKERFAEYYRMLAGAALEFRGTEYWSFHQDKMRQLGSPLRRSRVAGEVVRHVLNRCLPVRSACRWLSSAARRVTGVRPVA
jgi:glycosyltransferase involved in cell wall biosynthesis